jgi:hypothetical protein
LEDFVHVLALCLCVPLVLLALLGSLGSVVDQSVVAFSQDAKLSL